VGVKRPVVALGIDAASVGLLETWIEQGQLPALAALRARSSRAHLRGGDAYRAETPWTCFLTGCEPEQTGYWTMLRFSPGDYGVEDVGAYDFSEYAPFYALGESYRVAAFDLPQSRLSAGVNGVQVISWGAHSPLAPRGSQPAELLAEIESAFGRHPALLRDEATLWRPHECKRLERWLGEGIERRGKICEHLLQRERWDLFLTAFGESHSAGHHLWHRGREHPLASRIERDGGDPVLRTYQAIDRAIAGIQAAAPADAYTVVFTTEGMETNCMDLPSLVFLPELLYRLSFPDGFGLGGDGSGDLSEPEIPARGWVPAMWSTQAGSTRLRRFVRKQLPSVLSYPIDRLWRARPTSPLPPHTAGKLSYQPAMWYRHLWPQMKAFALPSFSEGYVRLNIKGREAAGVVDAADYDAVCSELAAEIAALTDSRSGKAIVREVRRTRHSALDDDPRLPDADLVVRWMPPVTDTVDSRTCGRIGPLPYYRSGGHTEQAFMWVAGPGVEAGVQLPDGRPTSLPPTLLALLGAPIPSQMRHPPLI